MECPLCMKPTMKPANLLPDLSGSTCSECSGVWIARAGYDFWRVRQSASVSAASEPAEFTSADVHKAKTCPECRHLLLPYRVGHGLAFSIDYCGACGGVWFDRNEWIAITARNLHFNLHDIMTAHWQAEVRRTEVQQAIEQTYRHRLGDSYARASEIRDWLGTQPQKSIILAYLAGVKPA